MSNIYIDKAKKTDAELFTQAVKLQLNALNTEHTEYCDPNRFPVVIPPTKRFIQDGANLNFSIVNPYSLSLSIYQGHETKYAHVYGNVCDIGVKVSRPTNNTRICALKLKARLDNNPPITNVTYPNPIYNDYYLFVSNGNSFNTEMPVDMWVGNQEYISYSDYYTIFKSTYEESRTGAPTYLGSGSNTSPSRPFYYGTSFIGNYMGLTSTTIGNIQTFLQNCIDDIPSHLVHIYNDGSVCYTYGFPSRSYFGYGNPCLVTLRSVPDFIPIFDASDESENAWITNAYDYLVNGNLHGDINPFDSSKEKHIIEDYKTDFTLYVTPYSSGGTHFSLTATNTEFTNNRAEIANDYCMMIATGRQTLNVSRTPQGQQTLTKSWHDTVTSHSDEYANSDYEIQCIFTKSLPTSEWLPTLQHHSGSFRVNLDYSATADCGVKIASVKWGDVWNLTETLSKVSINDGYIYTASSGETIKVLFRAITTDDLKDINDDGYDNKSDKEEENAGTTASEVCGHGLGTYKVSQAGFDAINDALWSTDWTQLFKSNTIDPVKCVISCKGIPFAHSGTVADTVYIANQAIACSAGKCNPVNTYDVGTYTISAVNNNFTDMTMTKVRVYLPYIAWVELPAEEVISRVGRAEVGLQSVTKRLNFKYIVDFVDGSCRCVISVNGTERWFFDGNCGIDIPVTSDNHTSAINNAIKSGLQSFMSVGLAVGSAYAGNAMGVASGATSAISSLANTIPTYNYSATANSSGYINHSMGNKLVIVIESPNIQMPNGYGHKYGFPCMRNLTLGGLSGYTKCDNVDLTGVNGTNYELNYIKSALESGVYL